MIKKKTFWLILFASIGSSPARADDKNDIKEMIARADRSRGLREEAMTYDFEVQLFSAGTQTNLKKYKLITQLTSAEATLTFPEKTIRESILVKGSFVWIAKEKSRRPTKVSLRERLSGSASVGDIMSMYFSEKFEVESVESTAETPKTKKITLKASAALVAYERVRIWLDIENKLVHKAEYLSPNLEILKTVNFIYENKQKTGNAGSDTEPFISKMIFIEKETTPTAVVSYGTPVMSKLDPDYFELQHVVDRLNNSIEKKP